MGFKIKSLNPFSNSGGDTWYGDAFQTAVDFSTGGATKLARGHGDAKRAEAEEDARNRGISGERWNLMQEGLQAGRDRGAEIYGQDTKATGADVQDILSRRRQSLDAPSRAESAMRSKGQNIQRRIASQGGSDAQQRQSAIETEQAAGLQGDMDRERRLQDFQSLIGNMIAGQSALEPGYAQLYMGSQYIAPEKAKEGLSGQLFSALGL